jgi:hypothetical protein
MSALDISASRACFAPPARARSERPRPRRSTQAVTTASLSAWAVAAKIEFDERLGHRSDPPRIASQNLSHVGCSAGWRIRVIGEQVQDFELMRSSGSCAVKRQ